MSKQLSTNSKTKPKIPVLPNDTWVEGDEYNIRYSLEEVIGSVKKRILNPETKTHVMVGTDSLGSGPNYRFITVVCAWDEGKGGTYFYKSSMVPRKTYAGSQKIRLQEEVTKSLEVAWEIEQTLGVKPQVHIDASPPGSNEFSGAFSENLKGYVLSSGYDAILKPESFVSNCIADKHTRKYSKRGRKHK